MSISDLQALVKTELHKQIARRILYTILAERPSWVPGTLRFEPGSRSASKKTFLKLISSVRKTVDVPVYIFTSEELKAALVKLVEKGVWVRVLTDAIEAREIFSQAAELRAQGVEACLGNTTMHHHKMEIIDRNCRLNGSMNWSKDGLNFNEENIEVHYRKESVADETRHQIYTKNFERKWKRNFKRSQKLVATQQADDAEISALLSADTDGDEDDICGLFEADEALRKLYDADAALLGLFGDEEVTREPCDSGEDDESMRDSFEVNAIGALLNEETIRELLEDEDVHARFSTLCPF